MKTPEHPGSCHHFCIYASQTDWLFVFSPKVYPQKPPCGVSGKLSSIPKPYKTAQLLRFFGKPLCHLRFLTQCVTYYKSTLIYYTIPGILFQAAIHTRRDTNGNPILFTQQICITQEQKIAL